MAKSICDRCNTECESWMVLCGNCEINYEHLIARCKSLLVENNKLREMLERKNESGNQKNKIRLGLQPKLEQNL